MARDSTDVGLKPCSDGEVGASRPHDRIVRSPRVVATGLCTAGGKRRLRSLARRRGGRGVDPGDDSRGHDKRPRRPAKESTLAPTPTACLESTWFECPRGQRPRTASAQQQKTCHEEAPHRTRHGDSVSSSVGGAACGAAAWGQTLRSGSPHRDLGATSVRQKKKLSTPPPCRGALCAGRDYAGGRETRAAGRVPVEGSGHRPGCAAIQPASPPAPAVSRATPFSLPTWDHGGLNALGRRQGD